MSDTNAEVTETVAEETQEQNSATVELPADHPLKRALAAQKAEIKELKAKAARLDEIEEATKTQAQRDAERIAAADAALAAVPSQITESLKAHLVTLHEIDSEDAELFLTATDPELLLKQVNRFLAQSGKPRAPKPDPNQGRQLPGATTPSSEFASFLQQQLNNT